MSNEVTKLNIDNKNIIIIGTAHVSKYSAQEVKEIIDEYQPDSVCIELDDERFKNLNNPKKFEDTQISEIIKNKQVFILLTNIILSSYQKRVANKLDVTAGQEMSQAITSAKEIDAKLVMIDRNVQVTFSRIWRKHSFFQKLKLMVSIIMSIFDDEDVSSEAIEDLKNSDMLESALKEISKAFPIVAEVLIFERDRILAHNIRNAKGGNIVAVVGAAHVPGILKALDEPDTDMSELCTVPPKTLSSKLIGWIIPAFIVGIIAYTMFQSTQMGLEQIKMWFLWNGVLSAIGVLLVKGHPLSILTALIAAPFTSLNPLIAAGWFAGLVEAMVRKPKASDFSNIANDVATFKGFMNNKVTHILMVVISANLFSTIGTIIGGTEVVKTFLNSLR